MILKECEWALLCKSVHEKAAHLNAVDSNFDNFPEPRVLEEEVSGMCISFSLLHPLEGASLYSNSILFHSIPICRHFTLSIGLGLWRLHQLQYAFQLLFGHGFFSLV